MATLEERVQEMDGERRRLTVKLQKTHEILRATASHALQDMRLSEANEAVPPPPPPPAAAATTTAAASAAASDARDKSFTSQLSSSFAFSSTGSTASTTPPPRTTSTTTGASAVGASSSSAVGTGLHRSHSFSGGVSVSSSQSTAARYQAPTAAVVSAHAQRYRYVAPDARQQTPLTTVSPARTNAAAVEEPHVPYSLRETHGRDHNYNALEHHHQPAATSSSSSASAANAAAASNTAHSATGHAFHPTKGHDASPEMHHWTTTALWQDASFVTDPSMSAVLSEKPSESDADSWLIKIRREDYASQNTSTISSTAPPPPPMSATYPSSRYGRSAGGSQAAASVGGMGSVTSTPMSKSMMDTSGDTLLGYTPEVPDYASRAAVARRQMVDQHRRSQSQSDRELQDIFQDIGRLTARLETRLNQSSPARATSVGSRSSASISGRYQYNHHK